jgi:hypothetical protein
VVEFDQDRFDALVLFVAHAARDERNFGRVKLAKTLFYSDFTAYRDEGQALTGATYIRLPKGPFPRGLGAAEARLEQAGLARLGHDVDEYEEKRIISLVGEGPARNIFEGWELAFVETQIREVASVTARAISDRSHEHAGWLLASHDGTPIAYETAFVPDAPPPAHAVEKAKQVARGRGWLVGDKWAWER